MCRQAQNAALEAQANTEVSERIKNLEQEVSRHREDSGKAQAEVDRLLEILREMENEKNDKDKKINELERWVPPQTAFCVHGCLSVTLKMVHLWFCFMFSTVRLVVSVYPMLFDFIFSFRRSHLPFITLFTSAYSYMNKNSPLPRYLTSLREYSLHM